MTFLLVPGLGNSGPEHWMSHWERALPGVRVEQEDWDDPDPEAWVAALDAAVVEAGPDAVLVAHSLGCATVVRWALNGRPVRAAMLVSPADVDSAVHTPQAAWRFAPMPMVRLPFPALVVASSDDPYVDLTRADEFANAWGARFANIGAKGHINSASGLGNWVEGRGLLRGLVGGCDQPS